MAQLYHEICIARRVLSTMCFKIVLSFQKNVEEIKIGSFINIDSDERPSLSPLKHTDKAELYQRVNT